MISVRASASPHDLVLLGCRRCLLTRRQSVSRCSYKVVSHAMAVKPIACTQIWKCSDHCFIPVVPLFDLASCSMYTVYQKSMQLAQPCARIRELQSVDKYVVTIARSREDEHHVYIVQVDNDGDGFHQRI